VTNETTLRVLIVDDNEMASELLSEFLELSGHAPQVAHTGAQALEIATAFAPDVAIVDIVLPDMDGYALADAMKHTLARPPKIVALSGLPKNMRRGDHSLFDAWLEKPADLETLEATLLKV